MLQLLLAYAELPHEGIGLCVAYAFSCCTWQEALQIFRKGPDCLRACPRAALAAGPSRYILRADYGWRERFGASGTL